jgi:peroxiredoxin
MKYRLVLLLILLFLSTSFIYSQETDNPKAKLYQDLINTELSLVNQKKVIKLKDYEDKIIVVILLASWCGPCTRQAEDLKKIQTEFQKKKLFMIGVNLDQDDREDFRIFLKKNKFNYLMGFAKEDLFKSFYSVSHRDAIPQIVIIHQREIKSIFVGGGPATERFRKTLQDIFSQK